MKKILLTVLLVLCMSAPVLAADLGNDFYLEGEGTIGHILNKDTGIMAQYATGEIGLRYKNVRGFLGGELLKGMYEEVSCGVDVFLAQAGGITYGIRGQYMDHRIKNYKRQDLYFIGFTVRF